MSPRKTYFQDEWLSKPEFVHIRKTKCRTEFFCDICKKLCQLSNMGENSILSHLKSKKHVQKLVVQQKSVNMRAFLVPKAEVSTLSSTLQEGSEKAKTDAISVNSDLIPEPSQSKEDVCPSPGYTVKGISKFLLRDDVCRAEILWCLHVVMHHSSMSSAGKAVKLFVRMFHDSRIAQSMQLQRVKIGYSIVYGLAPFFHEKVQNEAMECNAFVIFFDESLNKVSQSNQMDFAVRFWSQTRNEVCTRYLTSAFLGHSRACDLLTAFIENVPFKPFKLLQISMDGPNVNWRFMKDFESHIKSEYSDDCSIFLNMGSCGLHTVHNCFKTAFKASNWSVVQFLRAVYNVFKDVPARRAEYTRITGSKLFPLKFCPIRWVNNAPIAERGLNIFEHVRVFIEVCDRENLKICSQSFKVLRDAMEDKLMRVKLAFFAYVARLVEPFLVLYQSNDPLAPFLYTDLSGLIANILSVFVKNEVLEKSSSCVKIDLNDRNNLIQSKNLNFGHSVKAELRKISVSTDVHKKFREDCLNVLKEMSGKIMEKSPVKYRLCRAITFCDPALIVNHKSTVKSRLTSCLEIFAERNWVSPSECDSVEKEFRQLCSATDMVTLMKEYNRETCRIDHFWRGILSEQGKYKHLFTFIKKVLLLSHGNAYVERGFSINKEVLVENLAEKSLVAQRQIYDGVLAAGGFDEKFEVSKPMILKYRNAREKYHEFLKQQESEKNQKAKDQAKRRSVLDSIHELKEKRMKVLTEKALEAQQIEDEISNLTKLL